MGTPKNFSQCAEGPPGDTRTRREISTGQRVHNSSRPFATDAGAARSEGRRRSPRRRVRGRVHHPPLRRGGGRGEKNIPPNPAGTWAGPGEKEIPRHTGGGG